MRLIVATNNKSKLKEIKKILKGCGLKIISLADLEKRFRIVENGKTFRENALKKTLPVSRVYKDDYVVGEDSGLEVKHLGWAPGVYSKRYAGKNGDQDANNRKLLKALQGVPLKKRNAQFKCVLVLAMAGRVIKVYQGMLKGKIFLEPCGDSGFGYDPVFYLPEYKKTVAQLPLSIKNGISHRAKAFKKLKNYRRGIK
ncbi:MAG: RdgB/HAM1 family non-canonical purine NTP pyrophosphatase [Candidatus Omnitrophica bacterium]|nr:RdgB/HAM1 family non-canonical purine NTP pyrophosphatase [Candidatus Omnitrophota bacterium]MDD5429955.1 RdgB/HAM1 family non-canonical purine NTP pyrophosphatase [Candidatus Omnitrophota bacterium]